LTLLLASALVALPATSFAEDGEEQDPGPSSHVTIAFAGGAMLPEGAMKHGASMSMDVWSRVGWDAKNGLGVVLALEYAPLSRPSQSDIVLGTRDIESHLFTATAGPRFTLGHHTVRLWVSAGGGVVVERKRTVTTLGIVVASETDVETLPIVGGQAGLELHFFSNGGLSFAGAYGRSLTDEGEYEYVSVNAGLVFTI
jgi:hypothetical protein